MCRSGKNGSTFFHKNSWHFLSCSCSLKTGHSLLPGWSSPPALTMTVHSCVLMREPWNRGSSGYFPLWFHDLMTGLSITMEIPPLKTKEEYETAHLWWPRFYYSLSPGSFTSVLCPDSVGHQFLRDSVQNDTNITCFEVSSWIFGLLFFAWGPF